MHSDSNDVKDLRAEFTMRPDDSGVRGELIAEKRPFLEPSPGCNTG